VAGRYLVLCFFVSAASPHGRKAIDAALANRALFDDRRASFFGVSLDPGDEREHRVADSLPGIRFFFDFDGAVSRLYGAIPREAQVGQPGFSLRHMWIILDPTMRVLKLFPPSPDGNYDDIFAFLKELPPPERFAGIELQAPVLFLPNVFEPELCRRLISLYDTHGGRESGFMREVDGKTVEIKDPGHKRRRDYIIDDEKVIEETRLRVKRRIAPEIQKVHQFNVTRMERYIVSCYLAEEGGHFAAHRDNTTKGTAHRRFAVSINLNGEFDGGELSFPEYGPRSYKPPPGGAVVFSCSLLHAASPVTKGRRYAFLPFLYDDAAAQIREQNIKFLADSAATYKAEEGSVKAGAE
jgi:peroxiredoxin/predicted 2-oxoglutarate/Fe(II)-dependent dioxygenase YbiX